MYPSCLLPRALSCPLTFFLVVFEGGEVAVCEYWWFCDLLQSVFSGSSRSYHSLSLWIKGLFFSDRQTPFDNWVCAAVSGHLWCLLCSLYELHIWWRPPLSPLCSCSTAALQPGAQPCPFLIFCEWKAAMIPETAALCGFWGGLAQGLIGLGSLVMCCFRCFTTWEITVYLNVLHVNSRLISGIPMLWFYWSVYLIC